MENRLLDQFRNADGAVYQIKYYFFKEEPLVEERVYSRFDPEKMDFEFGNDGNLRFIMCIRTPVDDFDEFIPGNSFSVRMNPNRKIIDINPCLHTLDEHNWEYELDVFERFWFDFPTPFHKGDIYGIRKALAARLSVPE